MNETNFKHTEIGDIPHDWRIVRIGDIGYTYNGLTGKTKKDFGQGNSQFISFLNVLSNPIIDTSTFERVSVAIGENQNAVQKGDLFFNTSSETPEEVGFCSTLSEKVSNVYLNSFCFGFRVVSDDIYSLFLSYYFRSKLGRELMSGLAQGSTRYNLSKENFLNSQIALPSTIEEQVKISNVLKDVDEMVSTLEEVLSKKYAIKQGVMQVLFNGGKRLGNFSEKWINKKLSQILSVGNGRDYKHLRKGNVPVYGTGGLMCYVNDYLYEGETVCIGRKGTIDEPKYYNGKIWTVDTLFYTHSFNNAFAKFVYYLFCTIDWQSYNEATGVPSLSKKTIENIEVLIPPSIEEQQAIAKVLSDMDDEIHELEVKRDKYKAIKQGVMQQLLSGKIRLV